MRKPSATRSALSVLGLAASTMLAGCYTGLGDRPGASGDGSVGEGGSDGTAGEDAGDDGVTEEFEPAPVRLRVLLARHYTNAVRDLLGDEAAAVADPPEDTALNGWDAVGASQLALTDSDVERIEGSARAIAAVAFADATRIDGHAGCVPASPTDEACLEAFVAGFGRLAFRRTLDADELAAYTAVAVQAATDLNDFYRGAEAAIFALLQSPNFLYQVEIGEPDDDPAIRRLTSVEMATRLSFFLTGTTPDSDLIDMGEEGELATEAGVRVAAEELLARVEARAALIEFSSEWLRLRELPVLPKDPGTFPGWNEVLAASAAGETLALIDYVAWQEDGDFRDVFDADFTFVDSVMAQHYGLPNPAQYGSIFTQVTLPAEQKRGGILGNASLMALLGHVSSSSPTIRGKFVRENLMCQSVAAPPNDVDTTLPPATEAPTARDRLEKHMEDPSCSGCHTLMDPIGFGLENYDGIGTFRTLENGNNIDAASELDGTPFEGARELGIVLKEQTALKRCFVRSLFRNATGHIETQGESSELELIDDAWEAAGFRLQDALVELVASPAFRMVGPQE